VPVPLCHFSLISQGNKSAFVNQIQRYLVRETVYNTLFSLFHLSNSIALPALSSLSSEKESRRTSIANKPFFIAFILYRQHYQAQVIAQNPGLANPEISKIIGEQWRDQAAEVKNDWKRLAEVCSMVIYWATC
jgi:HMG (high mobility group) box